MNLFSNLNELNRQEWLKNSILSLNDGMRILDVGAGQLKNKKFCSKLNYVSQDFCQYKPDNDIANNGLHTESWDTSSIDIVSDILNIPEPDSSFDAILCTEVLEHVPEPNLAFKEFSRLLKPNGILILTTPFSSNVHMAPFHFYTGFTKYWYQYNLTKNNFLITNLEPNGDWYALLKQELSRLGGLERLNRNWSWPLAYFYSLIGNLYFCIRFKYKADDLACFGWNCIAMKK